MRKQGAGDQGLMFGYATNETDVLMPAPITYAHRLVKRQAAVRRSGRLPWLRPDAKSQILTPHFRYEHDRPVGIDEAVVLSTQPLAGHRPAQAARSRDGRDHPARAAEALDRQAHEVPHQPDRQVRDRRPGRRLRPDRPQKSSSTPTAATHATAAVRFPARTSSKVDRSAAYAARYVAKNVVAAGLAERCEVQVSYAIGVAEPTSVMVETFGTGKISRDKLTKLVRRQFDLTPYGLRQMLDLSRPIYEATAAYGHFGRTEHEFTWERTDKARALKADAR